MSVNEALYIAIVGAEDGEEGDQLDTIKNELMLLTLDIVRG